MKTKEPIKAPLGGPGWHVRSRADRCHASQRPFADGETIVSRLVLSDDYQREDYAAEAWNEELRGGSLYHWRTVFRPPVPKRDEPFKEENAEEAFRERVEQQDPQSANTLFILAVLLERKRKLVEKGVHRDPEGRLLRLYEHKESGEAFVVFDPELPLDQIGAVQDEVARMLGWIKPEPPPEVVEPVPDEKSES